ARQIRRLEFEAIRGCPRNCEWRAIGPKRPLGNWEGRTTMATTREPGDLPARSPNRWTGRPYGAVFRSGDGNAGAKAVRAESPTTFRRQAPALVGQCVLRIGLRLHPMRSRARARTQTKERGLWGDMYDYSGLRVLWLHVCRRPARRTISKAYKSCPPLSSA